MMAVRSMPERAGEAGLMPMVRLTERLAGEVAVVSARGSLTA
ncbi:hypothetical protein E6C60_0160 [Paenibacillus algicola]|uniref:Uncharacterized protein n=1 Tax=Paenibacillus algicola TaxID=2565926 RepID=A0A4P8XEY0_9BACL|nr:hypothetical protein E6C60_0160 [Paenibacillus algicola]